MNVRLIAPLVVLVSLCGGTAWARAEDPGVIQERRFRPQHELSLGVGYLPLDPLTKGLTGSLGYTLHMSDHLAWRVADVAFSSGFKSDLRKDLQSNYGRPDRDFDEPAMLATSELVWQALYGRESFFNRGVVWTGTTVHVGGGLVMMRTDGELAPRPAGLVGLGIKLHLDEDWGLRLEARNLLVVQELDLPDNVLWLSVAATWATGVR